MGFFDNTEEDAVITVKKTVSSSATTLTTELDLEGNTIPSKASPAKNTGHAQLAKVGGVILTSDIFPILGELEEVKNVQTGVEDYYTTPHAIAKSTAEKWLELHPEDKAAFDLFYADPKNAKKKIALASWKNTAPTDGSTLWENVFHTWTSQKATDKEAKEYSGLRLVKRNKPRFYTPVHLNVIEYLEDYNEIEKPNCRLDKNGNDKIFENPNDEEDVKAYRVDAKMQPSTLASKRRYYGDILIGKNIIDGVTDEEDSAFIALLPKFDNKKNGWILTDIRANGSIAIKVTEEKLAAFRKTAVAETLVEGKSFNIKTEMTPSSVLFTDKEGNEVILEGKSGYALFKITKTHQTPKQKGISGLKSAKKATTKVKASKEVSDVQGTSMTSEMKLS